MFQGIVTWEERLSWESSSGLQGYPVLEKSSAVNFTAIAQFLFMINKG